MDKVKVKDVRNGVVKEVSKSIAGDYIGTGNFKLVETENKSFSQPKFERESSMNSLKDNNK